MNFKSYVGEKFGLLEALERKVLNNRAYYHCKCECGGEITTRSDSLTSGKTRSCGCLVEKNSFVSNLKHNSSYTRLYNIYHKMKGRCYNENDDRYHRYGGRGITICEEWLEDYKAFESWSLENGYSDELSIDRIDNDGNYEPDNCRWATNIEQMNNTSRNFKVESDGVIMTLTEYCRVNELPYESTRLKINDGKIKGVKRKLEKGFGSSDEVHR